MERDLSLQTADYIVTGLMLLIPLGIGIFYAWKDKNKNTRDEYLLGGRKMLMLPVALSVFVSFQSAVSLIGFPSDCFQNGPMIFGVYVGIAIGFAIGYFTLIPLMYPLRLTSIFEYLELRYKSHAVRLLSTCIGMVQTFCYMVVALLAPGLAVQAVVGIPLWVCVFIVGGIGTVYTAVGGFKSVVWTDAFQTIIVFIGVFVLIIKGTMAVGGVEKVWTIAHDGGRTNFNHFSPDPRVRHTWWGLIIGIPFTWLTNIYNQSTLQRVSAMKNMQAAKKAYLINIPLNLFYGAIITIIGIVLYSYFYAIRWDPFQAGVISNHNQMVPFFMMHVLHDIPGLAGLFMATLFSGALSTLSSGINALAANTVEDIMGGILPSVSEKTATVIAKISVGIYGLCIIGLAYLCRYLTGPVTQMALSVFGACGGSVLGMFLIGSTVPWANKYGALTGGVVSLVLNIWIVVGGRLYGKASKHLPPVPCDHCTQLLSINSTHDFSPVVTAIENFNFSTNPFSEKTLNVSAVMGSEVYDQYAYSNFFYDLSYEWYSLTGTIMCTVIGLTVSWLTNSYVKEKVEPEVIIPLIRHFWSYSNGSSYEPWKLKERMMSTEQETEKGKCDYELNSLLNDKKV